MPYAHDSFGIMQRVAGSVYDLGSAVWLPVLGCRYAAEVSRLKGALRQQAQTDVDQVRQAVEHYKSMWEETQERVDRLNLQKQLLIKQVGWGRWSASRSVKTVAAINLTVLLLACVTHACHLHMPRARLSLAGSGAPTRALASLHVLPPQVLQLELALDEAEQREAEQQDKMEKMAVRGWAEEAGISSSHASSPNANTTLFFIMVTYMPISCMSGFALLQSTRRAVYCVPRWT